MKLVSTTLTGNNADIIGDALRSVVDWVDLCLVIDTGVTDASLTVARSIAGDKYVERKFAWIDDFAAARNFALDAARELGGDWALTLDTDERIELRGDDVRGRLGAAKERCFMVTHESGTYAKERFFALPASERFTGPTHESFPAYKIGYAVLPKARFLELPKSQDALRRKFERDARVLGAHTKAHPSDPRWFYYLGDSLQSLGRHEEAIVAYEACTALRGWNEESAWAAYRAAECWCALEKWDRAVDSCATGLARHSGIAELAWLAGFASWKAGRYDQAAWWSFLSISMGRFKGHGADVPRIGFRNLSALYEGPFDVLRFALKALGETAGAKQADALFAEARRAREGQPAMPSAAARKRSTKRKTSSK